MAYSQTEEITGSFLVHFSCCFIFWPVPVAYQLSGTGTGMQPAETGFRMIPITVNMSPSVRHFRGTRLDTACIVYVTMRYMADFTFTLTPLAVMGFSQGCDTRKCGVIKTFSI